MERYAAEGVAERCTFRDCEDWLLNNKGGSGPQVLWRIAPDRGEQSLGELKSAQSELLQRRGRRGTR